MRVNTISATSLDVFENCPERFWAEKVVFADDLSSQHADLGTACHAAFERWVAEGWHAHRPMADVSVLVGFFIEAYFELFKEVNDFYDQGIKMVTDWYNNQDWNGVEVISTEEKKRFSLKIPGDEDQLVTYIFDRLDMWTREPGATPVPRVVDYKSVGQPISGDQMKQRIQPQLYGLAAQLLYPDAPGVWVEYDLLRYDRVGVYFTKEENREFYRYLQGAVKRIRAMEPITDRETGEVVLDELGNPQYPEVLNQDCRWCVRKHSCKTLQANIMVGGRFATEDVNEAIDKSAQLKFALDAMKKVKDDLDEFVMQELLRDECSEAETPETKVVITSRSTSHADPVMVAKVAGTEMVARYAKLTMAQINQLLKDPELTDEQRSQIRQLIEKRRGNAYLKYTSKKAEEE